MYNKDLIKDILLTSPLWQCGSAKKVFTSSNSASLFWHLCLGPRLIEKKGEGSFQSSILYSRKQLGWFVIRFQNQREHFFVFWVDCWWRYWLAGLWIVVNQMRAESYQVSSLVLWLWKFVDFAPLIHHYRIQRGWLRKIGLIEQAY